MTVQNCFALSGGYRPQPSRDINEGLPVHSSEGSGFNEIAIGNRS
jgi:hypothetical protein